MQLDIKNAFLHAPIDSKIYLEQPIGFTKYKHKICKLNKSLYRLKQAPRAQYLYLKEKLELLGYYPIFAEQGIFTNKELNINKKIFIIVYVDDILLLGNNIKQINTLKTNLSKLIKVTDLGEASYFLGMEITRDRVNKTLKLTQNKYVQNILKQFNKDKLNPVSTPSDPSVK